MTLLAQLNPAHDAPTRQAVMDCEMLLPDLGYWLPCKDGDPRAFAIMSRHYSFQKYADGRRDDIGNANRHLFVGPGSKMVLLGVDELAPCLCGASSSTPVVSRVLTAPCFGTKASAALVN